MKPKMFFQSDAPAVRARRDSWIKIIVVYLWIAAVIGVVVLFEDWFASHTFAAVLFTSLAFISAVAFGATWRFNVPCPRCKWNINLAKEPSWALPLFVPSTCPNCGLDLTVSRTERE